MYVVSYGYFFLDKQKEVTRLQAREPALSPQCLFQPSDTKILKGSISEQSKIILSPLISLICYLLIATLYWRYSNMPPQTMAKIIITEPIKNDRLAIV